MKFLLVLATVVVAVQLAEIPWVDPSSPDNHYSTHKDTIQEARKLVAERLQEFGANDVQLSGNELQTSGANGDPLCTVSCVNGGKTSSSASSDAEDIQRSGVGYVGFNGLDSSKSEFAHQSEFSATQENAGAAIVIPGGSNSQSVYHQSHNQVSRTNPGYVAPVVYSGAIDSEQIASQSEHISQNSPTAVYPISGGGSADSYASNVNHVAEINTGPVHTISYPVGGSQQRYASNLHRVSETSNSVPLRVAVYPSGGESERYLSHSEQSSETRNAPAPAIAVYPSVGSESRFSSQLEHKSETAAAAPVYYTSYPATGSQQRYVGNYNHVSESNNAPYVPYGPISGSENYAHRSERIAAEQRRPAPISIVYQPTGGSSERYVSSNIHRSTVNSAPVAPIIYSPPRTSERFVSRQEHFRDSAQQPIVTYIQPAASSHSARYSNEESRTRSQRQQPTIVNYPSSQYSASSNNFEHDTQSAFGVAPHFGAGANFEQNSNSNYHSTFGQRPSSRIGSSRRYTSGASENLSSYMSEAERLARAQAQTGSAYNGGYNSANVGRAGYGINGAADYGNVEAGNANLANGGFVRTKSWENNEKWSSGSEYDENGKLRTYSNLSTGESELHNVNGKVAGYKAATTTVEDNGRSSTYSIHT